MIGKARLAGIRDNIVRGINDSAWNYAAQKHEGQGKSLPIDYQSQPRSYKAGYMAAPALFETATFIQENPLKFAAGTGLTGLGIGALMFSGNEQQAQAPQQSLTVAPVPASASQAMPQMAVPMLNEEQVSKARKRAEEQAALNAFYAQSLNNYGQQPGGQY